MIARPKFLTAGLVALTLAASPMAATPARADSEDLALALLGLAALAAIANELDDIYVKPKRGRGHGKHDDRYDRYDRHDRYGRAPELPARCVLQLDTPRGNREVVMAACLERDGLRRALPEYCSAPHASRLLGQRAYGLDCLRAEGYRVGRYR
ncbi:hypothetical protein [Actibacterium sp. MT2.3-13A]|uniref:hypothetical protein n=1 Tax=Actibacterium sp. MT2.3-13A TaxID=2828332 RepID=UPI001BAB99CE|nr:hypothetical protein [Actibacterium sp. MT2.3-13A]